MRESQQLTNALAYVMERMERSLAILPRETV